jgi:uncharacterized cupin superfamily protein
MSDQPSSKNASGLYEPFASEVVPWETYGRGERYGVRFRQLGDYGGGTRVGVCLEELAPGKQAYPAHYHMLEEEHLFVLEGALTVRLGDERHPMKAGDYVCFPAGQRVGHAVINESETVCRYLIIGERNPADVVIYPDSGRVGVRLTGEGYRRSATMDYWEGLED